MVVSVLLSAEDDLWATVNKVELRLSLPNLAHPGIGLVESDLSWPPPLQVVRSNQEVLFRVSHLQNEVGTKDLLCS